MKYGRTRLNRPVKATQLAKLITEEFDYDFEKLTEQDETWKTPKSILKDFNQKLIELNEQSKTLIMFHQNKEILHNEFQH